MATLTDSEFNARAEAALAAVEAALERSGLDVECERQGSVLQIELANGSRIVVNSQAAMRQLWLAARSGGYHYDFDGRQWRDTRDGTEFFAALSRVVSEQGGEPVILRGD